MFVSLNILAGYNIESLLDPSVPPGPPLSTSCDVSVSYSSKRNMQPFCSLHIHAILRTSSIQLLHEILNFNIDKPCLYLRWWRTTVHRNILRPLVCSLHRILRLLPDVWTTLLLPVLVYTTAPTGSQHIDPRCCNCDDRNFGRWTRLCNTDTCC